MWRTNSATSLSAQYLLSLWGGGRSARSRRAAKSFEAMTRSLYSSPVSSSGPLAPIVMIGCVWNVGLEMLWIFQCYLICSHGSWELRWAISKYGMRTDMRSEMPPDHVIGDAIRSSGQICCPTTWSDMPHRDNERKSSCSAIMGLDLGHYPDQG